MKNTKLTAALLAAALTVSLAGCGSATSSSAEPEATPEVTATPEPTAEPTPEPTPEPTAAPVAERSEPAWLTSHNGSDFNIDDLLYVNSAAYQTTPGDGTAFCASMQQYNYIPQPESGAPSGEVEEDPFYDASIYTWYDADGTLHWYRDGKGTVGSTVIEVDPNGDYGTLYAARLDGSTARGYYPTQEAMQRVLQSNGQNTFLSSYTSASVYSYSPDTGTNFYQDYAQYLDGATYEGSISGNNGEMDLYIDDNMNVVSMLYQLFGGAQNARGYYPVLDFYTQEVTDSIPDTSAVTDKFAAYDTVTCTVVTDDGTYEMPMSAACTSYLTLYNNDLTIEVSPAVEAFDDDGNSLGEQTTLTSGQDFVLTEPVTFTIH